MLAFAMRVIARSTLTEYLEARRGRQDCKALKCDVDAWYAEAKRATWANTAEVKRRYKTASIITSRRVVFNIKGNDYRLIVDIVFKKQIIFITWIGTHEEYDKIDARTVKYED